MVLKILTHILKAFTEYVINHILYGREERKPLKKREKLSLKRDHRMDKPRGKICDGSLTVDWDIYSVVVKEIR